MDALKVCRSSSSSGLFIGALEYKIGGIYNHYGPVVITGLGFEPSYLLMMQMNGNSINISDHNPLMFDKNESPNVLYVVDSGNNANFIRNSNRDYIYNNNMAGITGFYMDNNEIIINAYDMSDFISAATAGNRHLYVVASK